MFAGKPVHSGFTLQKLIERGPIEVAIDTEFKDAQTLSIQTATRLSPRRIVVQVYRSTAIPRPPRDFKFAEHLPTAPETYDRFFKRAVLRPIGKITHDLSPVQILTNLFAIEGVQQISRHQGRLPVAQAPNRIEKKNGPSTVPTIRLVVVGHFLQADFGRMFGSSFFDDLFYSREGGERGLELTNRKLVGLAYSGATYAEPPIIEYACDPDGNLYQIRLETRDTNVTFGEASLDSHSRTFLGAGKGQEITEVDKADMLATFREKPRESYAYGIRDVVNTLLIHEQMKAMDAQIYQSFGVDDADIPPTKPTTGRRSSRFLIHMTKRAAAASSPTRPGP